MRLSKLLCTLGCGSRTQVSALCKAGRVVVNGRAEKDAALSVDPSKDTIRVDGVPLAYEQHIYGMLNKPAGVLTAARDASRPTVADLLPADAVCRGCMPVGRLDMDTEGLLLFTTEGTLAHRLLAPKRRVEKVYEAHVDGPLTSLHAQAFQAGIPLHDGVALPATLTFTDDPLCVRITVTEGRYHQVKRMVSACGRTVTHLKRLSFGGIPLPDSLAKGAYRPLTPQEITTLYRAAGMEPHG